MAAVEDYLGMCAVYKKMDIGGFGALDGRKK